MARVILRLAPWLSVAALAIAWELVARSGAVTPFMLPRFTTVVERIWEDGASGELWQNLGLTLYRALLGFAIATLLGVGLGFAVSYNRFVRWLLDPVISVGFPMPKIAFLPIITLWLGFHDVSKISMVVFDAVFPVLTATTTTRPGAYARCSAPGVTAESGASAATRND